MWTRLLRGRKRAKAPSRLSSEEVRGLVRALYRGFLEQEPTPKRLQYWAHRIESGAFSTRLVERFLRSPEHVANAAAERQTDELCRSLASGLTAHGFRGPLTIVDVGAQLHQNKDHVYARLPDLVPCRIIGFEPLDQRRREREEAEGGNNLSMRPDFIGDGRTHVFHINEPDVTSSLLPFNTEVTQHLVWWNQLRTVRQASAGTVTLDTAIGDVERVDLLQLDVQGFEHAALAGAQSVLARTLAVQCEVEFIELYKGQPLFAEIDQLLRRAGFRFLDLCNMNRHAFNSRSGAQSSDQLTWADAIYFKDRAQVGDPADLLVQALIATAVYKKTSFARWLAEDYAARTGRSVASLLD